MARERLAASMARWALHPTAGFALTPDPSAFLVFSHSNPGRANKAVPAGWIRRIVDARFAMQ